MKVVDIKSRQVEPGELPQNRGVHFQLAVEPINKFISGEIKKEEARTTSSYGLEVGRTKMPSRHPSWRRPFHLLWAFFKTIRLVSFSFRTQFGLKKYRVKVSFLLGCLLVFFLVNAFGVAGSVMEAKSDLAQKSLGALMEGQPAKAQSFFDASLALKEANKRLASLGKIPELAGALPFASLPQAAKGAETLTKGSAWAELFLRLAGFYQPRYYLILFQNSAEIRATGGFVGSYALVKVDNGNVEIKKAENVFNISGQQSLLLTPPLPIQKISENWTFHDLNWFFDFPTSASLLSWMYEKNGGPTLDGVIAITPGVVEDLLGLVGPLYLPSYDLTFSQGNFFDTLQYEVEDNFRKRGINDPKSIITSLAPLLEKRLAEYPNKEKFVELILNSLAKKDVLAFMKDEREESFLLYQNWAGSVLHDNNDYLAVVDSNINGYKTDRVIKQVVRAHTTFDQAGGVTNTVSITRSHQGGALPYPWYNKVNANFLRVYVPKGSTLLETRGQTLEFHAPRIDYRGNGFRTLALVQGEGDQTMDPESGTRILEEGGKTVWGNWTYVSPKETTTIVYRYKLPFALDMSRSTIPYQLTVQKQPGVTERFSWNVTYPPSWQALWKSDAPSTLDRDTRLGIMFQRNP